jgi:sarcosine oxidase subunit alpha
MPEGSMAEEFEIRLNGKPVRVREGVTVAAAIAAAGEVCRRSVTGEARSALCGMGICFECRATVDGRPHMRTCRILCRAGMEVRTDD